MTFTLINRMHYKQRTASQGELWLAEQHRQNFENLGHIIAAYSVVMPMISMLTAEEQVGASIMRYSRKGCATKNVVYRELSMADRAALEAGQPLVPKGSGGTILEHIRGQPTGHISASETIGGTSRFSGGNGLAAIDVDVATAGGTQFIPKQSVLDAVAPRVKQIQKVQDAAEVLFEGPIRANAVRLIKGN